MLRRDFLKLLGGTAMVAVPPTVTPSTANSIDSKFSGTRVYYSTTNNFEDAKPYFEALPSTNTYYYWISHVDRSGKSKKI